MAGGCTNFDTIHDPRRRLPNVSFALASSNAMRHKTNTRPERQDEANITTQTLIAGNYAETGERGFGLVHAIVRRKPLFYGYLQLLSFVHSAILNQ
jgi:hypothetical protein